MTRGETLKSDQIREFLLSSQQEHADVVLSFTRQGKWHLHHTHISDFNDDFIALRENTHAEEIAINQPVGICVHLGRFKYLFETSIQSIEAKGQSLEILLDFPEKVEQIQRRAFERQAVPSNLKVKCLFWHRGYLDDSRENPLEQYWQGRLLNLSAGGSQIAVDLGLKDYFSVGQLVGVQFTPMSYQRPLLLEAHVKYLVDQSDQNQFLVGVEFLGLEAGPEGHDVLHRLVRVIHDYEKMNEQNQANSLTA